MCIFFSFVLFCLLLHFRWPGGLCRPRLLRAAELWLWPPVSRLRRPLGPVAAEPADSRDTPITHQHTHTQLLPPHTLPPWQGSYTHSPWRRALWYQVCVLLTFGVCLNTFMCLFCVSVSLSCPQLCHCTVCLSRGWLGKCICINAFSHLSPVRSLMSVFSCEWGFLRVHMPFPTS